MTNYFLLFDVDENYALDISILKKKYLTLQAKFHPDRAISEENKKSFLNTSMLLNEGYMTLIDEYKRAEHLLMIKGVVINKTEAKNFLTPEDLEKIWTLNETLESHVNLSDLFLFEKDILAQKESLIEQLKQYFIQENIQKAVELSVKLKYLTNLIKNIRLKIKDANN